MNGPTPSEGDAKPASSGSGASAWAVTIVMNIVLPTVTFFLLTGSAGMSDVPALLLSGVWPLIEIAITVARQHHVDEFSAFVLFGIAVGVFTTAISDSARAVFFKDSITTGLVGLAFLVSLFLGRPLTFYFGRRFATDGSQAQRDWWDGLWRHPEFRRIQRGLGLAWALALLGEAVVRAVLTYSLGTSAMVTVNNVVPYAVVAVMVVVSVSVGRRAQAGASRRGRADAMPPMPSEGEGVGGIQGP